jgi:regulator of replication initiation timing
MTLRSQLYYMLSENDCLKEEVSSLKSSLETAAQTFRSDSQQSENSKLKKQVE